MHLFEIFRHPSRHKSGSDVGKKSALAVLVPLLAICCLPAAAQSRDEHHFDVMKQLEVFTTAYGLLDQDYVDTLDAKKRIGDALDFLLYSLDPYTEYFPEEDSDDLRQLTTGKYAGIGSVIGFSRKANRCYISWPSEGNPAARAGLRPGDILLSIDGKDLGHPKDTTATERNAYTSMVSSKLRGEPGTTFELRVHRPYTDRTLLFKITRQQIATPPVLVAQMLTDEVGYVSLEQFTEGAASELRTAVASLKGQGARRLVLDLRSNPGGLITEAVDVVNIFVPRGRDVVSVRGKSRESDRTLRTSADPLDTEIPLCVLVNGSSASASEIVSGALQDMDRGVIVGERTYGKGLVQGSHSLPYNGTLKLTTARYYIPSGRCVQAYEFKDGEPVHLADSLAQTFHTSAGRPVKDGGGVTPDVQVASEDTIPYVVQALMESDEIFEYACQYRGEHSVIPTPDKFRLTDEEYREMGDFLIAHGFTYTRPAAKMISALRTLSQREGMSDETAPLLDQLAEEFATNLRQDFRRHERWIRRVAESYIVRQYYYDRGFSQYFLRDDVQLNRALEILSDTQRYRDVLRVKN